MLLARRRAFQMQYFSTNHRSPAATFDQATLAGQPDDGGLFFPSAIPKFPAGLFDTGREKAETAFEVIRPYVGGTIPDDALVEICRETVDFDFPLVKVTEQICSLELFHGPTFAFKDVGARFISRRVRHFASDIRKKIVVQVETSGDTVGAVASGFFGVENVEVVILYPKGRVSRIQELQLTTLGGNVTTLELRGSFDDCQRLAKRALGDADLKEAIFLTSANSINVARWLPQQFYYVFAAQRMSGEPVVFSVPSGNFGNIAAGLLAHSSGMPSVEFIAACNANRVVAEFFSSGSYDPQAAIATLSNAMDVGDPSNFVRVLELFGGSVERLKNVMSVVSVSDAETELTMREVYGATGYVLDPHGAVAYRALADRLAGKPQQAGIFLETAHPVKFDSVERILGTYGSIPPAAAELNDRQKVATEIAPDYDILKEILIAKA
jgi:threonine synthase